MFRYTDSSGVSFVTDNRVSDIDLKDIGVDFKVDEISSREASKRFAEEINAAKPKLEEVAVSKPSSARLNRL